MNEIFFFYYQLRKKCEKINMAIIVPSGTSLLRRSHLHMHTYSAELVAAVADERMNDK